MPSWFRKGTGFGRSGDCEEDYLAPSFRLRAVCFRWCDFHHNIEDHVQDVTFGTQISLIFNIVSRQACATPWPALIGALRQHMRNSRCRLEVWPLCRFATLARQSFRLPGTFTGFHTGEVRSGRPGRQGAPETREDGFGGGDISPEKGNIPRRWCFARFPILRRRLKGKHAGSIQREVKYACRFSA